MKEVKLLMYASGENQGTYDIKCIYDEKDHKDLLDKKCFRFISHDFNQQVEVKEYYTITTKVPDWFCDSWFKSRDYYTMKWYAAFGFNIEWDLLRYLKLSKLSTKNAFYIIKLINTKPRSEFKISLKERAIEWLDSRKNTFRTPFTEGQWNALYNKWDEQKYKDIDIRLYKTKSHQIFE